MVVVGVREAKARFSELIDRALAGEEVTITRRGIPVARLEALPTNHPRESSAGSSPRERNDGH